jgi:hypothetical protein
MTREDLISINRETSEIINYCRYRQYGQPPGKEFDIYQTIERLAQNFQILTGDYINLQTTILELMKMASNIKVNMK